MHRIEIETDPSKNGGNILISASAKSGVSREYDGNRIIAEETADGSSLRQEADREFLDNGTAVGLVSVSGNESNPLLMGAPPITYSFAISVISNGADKPLSVGMDGKIDGFPGYEIVVERPESKSKSSTVIWSFDPKSRGNGPACLVDYYCDENVGVEKNVP